MQCMLQYIVKLPQISGTANCVRMRRSEQHASRNVITSIQGTAIGSRGARVRWVLVVGASPQFRGLQAVENTPLAVESVGCKGLTPI